MAARGVRPAAEVEGMDRKLPVLKAVKPAERFSATDSVQYSGGGYKAMYLNKLRDTGKEGQHALTPVPPKHRASPEKLYSGTPVKYRPYSLWDYRAIRPKRYLELGGLGAGRIGSDDWKVAQNKWQRMKKYAEVFKIDR